MTAVDIYRDAIYRVDFREIILNNISEITFGYNQQTFQEQTFTLTITFNFYDVHFILNDEKVLSLSDGELPVIKQRNWTIGDDDKVNP